jgi:hypothetical protein
MSARPEQALSKKANDAVTQHLDIFEELDFEAYSKQNWNKFSESHAASIRFRSGHKDYCASRQIRHRRVGSCDRGYDGNVHETQADSRRDVHIPHRKTF